MRIDHYLSQLGLQQDKSLIITAFLASATLQLHKTHLVRRTPFHISSSVLFPPPLPGFSSPLPTPAYAGGRSSRSAASEGPPWSGGRQHLQLGSERGCDLQRERIERMGEPQRGGRRFLIGLLVPGWPLWRCYTLNLLWSLNSFAIYSTCSNFSVSKKQTLLLSMCSQRRLHAEPAHPMPGQGSL